MTFTNAELKRRALYRVAFILHQQWEESGGGDTRLFDWLVNDDFVYIGTSIKGSDYREHVVPRAVIRDLCIQQFEKGKDANDVVDLIDELLMIARISKEEADHLDHTLGYKSTMPPDWKYGHGDNRRRLIEAGIKLEKNV
ncbi:MAG: hypothetical protein OEY61_04755 [Gammaproteobacteria bacterium]|nr:hypothetical protein [Gammaproteobacteria bacterium]